MNKKNDDSSSTTLTVGSLFAGIGGFELGFEATGRFETLWQVERDEYASRVLAKHWPNVPRHDDVCTWPNETTEPVDVLLAGFPCQDISYAGKGAGLNGKRSGLFYEVMRIVREMGPRYIVLENVSALLTRGMGDVLGTLSSLGYDAEWEVISAESVGARHRRDRVFVIGWNTHCGRSGGNLADSASSSSSGQNSQRPDKHKSREKSCGAVRSGGDTRDVSDASSKQQKRDVEKTFSGERTLSRESGRGSSDERGISPTIPALGRVADGVSLWLDEPRIGRTAKDVVKRRPRLRCLGNAIVPQVAKVVAERVLQMDDENRGSFSAENRLRPPVEMHKVFIKKGFSARRSFF